MVDWNEWLIQLLEDKEKRMVTFTCIWAQGGCFQVSAGSSETMHVDAVELPHAWSSARYCSHSSSSIHCHTLAAISWRWTLKAGMDAASWSDSELVKSGAEGEPQNTVLDFLESAYSSFRENV